MNVNDLFGTYDTPSDIIDALDQLCELDDTLYSDMAGTYYTLWPDELPCTMTIEEVDGLKRVVFHYEGAEVVFTET